MRSVIALAGLMVGVSVCPALATTAETTDFYCYIVEQDGRLINLAELCIEEEAFDATTGQGDLPIACNFQAESAVVDQVEASLSLAIPFTCQAEGDIAASNIALRLLLDGEASSEPVNQAVPALAMGETYEAIANFTVASPPDDPNSVAVEYIVQEGLQQNVQDAESIPVPASPQTESGRQTQPPNAQDSQTMPSSEADPSPAGASEPISIPEPESTPSMPASETETIQEPATLDQPEIAPGVVEDADNSQEVDTPEASESPVETDTQTPDGIQQPSIQQPESIPTPAIQQPEGGPTEE